MYAVVAHHFWGTPGGGQLVCSSAARALEELGYMPVLTGTFRFDPRRYLEWYGLDISKYPVVTLPLDTKAFGLWTRLFVWWPAKKAIEKYGPSLLFTDEVTYGPIASRPRSYKIVEYIHFPFEVVYDPKFRGTGLAYGEDPYIMERYGRFPMNLYWAAFVWGVKRFSRGNPFHSADVVLTNSRWTAQVAKLVYGEEPKVLNPPLPPTVEVIKEPKPFEEREDLVVMLGRFSQEKRYHWVVEEVAPALAKMGAKLVIFGGATTPTLQAYLEQVKSLAEKRGLKTSIGLQEGAEVSLVPNAPRSLILKVMDRAKVFLHATINEHWGIAVAEAMARGLPIVVHKSGGTWTDLAEEGARGLGYGDAGEAVEAVAKLLADSRLWRALGAAGLEKAGELTFENFKRGLGETL